MKNLKLTVPFFLILISLNVFSYAVTDEFAQGMYWRSFPISFKVVNNLSPIDVDLEGLAEEAFNRWESVVGRDIWEINSSSSNVIRWSNNFQAETGEDETKVWAVSIRTGRGTYYTKTSVILNAKIPQMKNIDTLSRVLTHEIAHSIGVGHSEYFGSIMYSYVEFQNNSINLDDVRAINYVVEETERRQSIGYVSPVFANSDFSSSPLPVSCGTIGDSNSSSGNTTFGIIISLLFGIILTRRISFYKI